MRLEPGTGPAVLARLNEDTTPNRSSERVSELTQLELAPFETVRIDA